MTVATLSNKHPNFISRELDWTMARDAYGGERYIKDKAEQYLPPTTSMLKQGMAFRQDGWNMYQAYRARAVYHELVKPALQSMLGVMHRKEADIELPAKLEKMRDRMTFGGDDAQTLLQKINEQQLLMGRYGLLLDVETDADINSMPYIVGYNAENIINWDTTRVSDDSGPRKTNLVVLNETCFERRNGLSWVQIIRYRVLAQAGGVRDAWNVLVPDDSYIAAEVKDSQDAQTAQFVQPSFGGRTLDCVPFVFIGPRDLVPEPDLPVLMPLVRLGLAIYRVEADYRQALYMQGQDTLVVTGQQATAEGATQTIGAFGSIDLPMGGDAKYIGATADGIQFLENSIQNDLKRAAQLGAQLLSERGNEAEATSALNVRVASRTATLTTVAKTGALGLQNILRHAAEWLDADPDKVKVTPNLDFADDGANAQELTYLMTGKSMGAPLSKRSIHGWLTKREFTTLTFEQEQKEINDEGPDVLPTRGVVGPLPGAGGAPGEAAPIPGAAPKGAKVAAAAAGA